MSIELTDERKFQIILNAVAAAGPSADDALVAQKVSQTVRLIEDGSPALNAFAAAEKRAENTVDTKTFTGVLLYADVEGLKVGDKEPSNRPIVFLYGEPSQYAPDGVELARLDRLDAGNGVGEMARDLAKKAVSLIGHKVAVTIAIEKANGRNVRVLRGIDDRGAEPGFEGVTNETGWQKINWQDPRFAPISPRLKALNTKYRVPAAA